LVIQQVTGYLKEKGKPIQISRFSKLVINSTGKISPFGESIFSYVLALRISNSIYGIMIEEGVATNTTGTKKHYLILDGLRGIAAIAVVIFHFMEWVFSDASKNFIAHGFLAVDFFFCLSGFVIAYAYDDRIRKAGPVDFFKSRLIRLHPLVILGSVLGLLAFLFDPYASAAKAYGIDTLALLFVCSVLMIPAPMMAERSLNLFGLNAPSWSLFWEYVANILYALVLVRINPRLVIILTILSVGMLSVVSYNAGNLLGGWAGDNFWDGGARVFYSFLAGMLIYRYNLIIRNRLGFPLLALLLSFAFLMPWSEWNWLTELVVVMIYFPALISLGAGSSLSPRLQRLCRFSGNLSYPLYMTHYCAIWIFGNYLSTAKPPMEHINYIIAGGVIFLICFAYLTMRFFDIPVRRYLSQRRRREKETR
jgi:peptidoglycan/LPS O-acetylase OafA/YrhL